jgi:hypothetical protein
VSRAHQQLGNPQNVAQKHLASLLQRWQRWCLREICAALITTAFQQIRKKRRRMGLKKSEKRPITIDSNSAASEPERIRIPAQSCARQCRVNDGNNNKNKALIRVSMTAPIFERYERELCSVTTLKPHLVARPITLTGGWIFFDFVRVSPQITVFILPFSSCGTACLCGRCNQMICVGHTFFPIFLLHCWDWG